MIGTPMETLAVLIGIAIGLIIAGIASARMRWRLWLVLSVAGGIGVSWINGEFPLSAEFLLFDIPLVAGIALAIALSIRRLHRKALTF